MEIKGVNSVDIVTVKDSLNRQNIGTGNNANANDMKNENINAQKIKPEEKDEKSQKNEIQEEQEKSQSNNGKYNRRFEYSIHQKTNRVMIKVINTDNDEVIKEIPAEKMLDMLASMCEWAGLFFDKKF